ncbi:MAG: hypothetical protein MZV63_41265 [Marinilabiliales bacterium]|nr:hypothetical protein [Marinilabiliales bacterium]
MAAWRSTPSSSSLFLLVFGGMWVKEVLEVIADGHDPRLRHRPGGLLAGPGLRPRVLDAARPDQRLPALGPAEQGLSRHLPVLRLLLHPDRRRPGHGHERCILSKDPTFLWRDLVGLRRPGRDHRLRVLLCPAELQGRPVRRGRTVDLRSSLRFRPGR